MLVDGFVGCVKLVIYPGQRLWSFVTDAMILRPARASLRPRSIDSLRLGDGIWDDAQARS